MISIPSFDQEFSMENLTVIFVPPGCKFVKCSNPISSMFGAGTVEFLKKL